MALGANFLLMVLAAVMAGGLLGRYRERPRPHTLAYAVSFILIALAGFFDFFAHLRGVWPETLYLYYWISVATLVPVMAAGSIYLFSPRAGNLFLALVCVAAVLMYFVTLAIQVDPAILVAGDISSLKPPEALQPFTKNLPRLGVVVILGGNLWTWYKTKRPFVLWISLGAILFSLAGMLAVRVGSVGFYLLQAGAIVALYKGVGVRPSSAKAAVAKGAH